MLNAKFKLHRNDSYEKTAMPISVNLKLSVRQSSHLPASPPGTEIPV